MNIFLIPLTTICSSKKSQKMKELFGGIKNGSYYMRVPEIHSWHTAPYTIYTSSPPWLYGNILGTTSPLTIYITVENQWGVCSIVNLDKMFLAILVAKEHRLYACRSVPYFFLEQRYHFRSHFVLMNNSVTIRTDR